MGPVFNILMLDILSRQLNNVLLNPSIGLKVPIVARAAMSLTFNLLRLKISTRFTKGLPYGIGTIANFALKISALQIALDSLPIFFNPANYATPKGDADFGVGNAVATTQPSPALPFGNSNDLYSQ